MKRKKNIFKELKVQSIGFEGISIARDEEMVYFVKGGVPGDLVNAKILKKRKNYTESIIENIIEPSPDRIEPICSHFDYCGGCSWQNISYSDQLKWKKQHVTDAVHRIANVKEAPIHDTIASEPEFHYRNKMDFTFGASRWLMPEEIADEADIEDKQFALGMHVRGRYDKIINIEYCHIQSKIGNNIIKIAKELALESDVPAFHVIHKTGFLRSLVLRNSNYENSMMVILVTTSPKSKIESDYIAKFCDIIISEHPEIKSFIHAINDTISPVAIGEVDIIFGENILRERILDVIFEVSPFSFFQTNSYQLDKFIGKIIEYSELSGDETIWDLYCGTGSITLPMSRKCKAIYGVELVESSINDAKSNAKLNNLENVNFYTADLHATNIPDVLNKLPHPDVLIVDPPRAGLHKNLLSHIMEIRAEKMIYVSCNPSTQARDFQILKEIYDIIEIQPFDMFPQTYHIESIAKLKLRK